jgi:hypothetical protein
LPAICSAPFCFAALAAGLPQGLTWIFDFFELTKLFIIRILFIFEGY